MVSYIDRWKCRGNKRLEVPYVLLTRADLNYSPKVSPDYVRLMRVGLNDSNSYNGNSHGDDG